MHCISRFFKGGTDTVLFIFSFFTVQSCTLQTDGINILLTYYTY